MGGVEGVDPADVVVEIVAVDVVVDEAAVADALAAASEPVESQEARTDAAASAQQPTSV
jgi:hypothetical protein